MTIQFPLRYEPQTEFYHSEFTAIVTDANLDLVAQVEGPDRKWLAGLIVQLVNSHVEPSPSLEVGLAKAVLSEDDTQRPALTAKLIDALHEKGWFDDRVAKQVKELRRALLDMLGYVMVNLRYRARTDELQEQAMRALGDVSDLEGPRERFRRKPSERPRGASE